MSVGLYSGALRPGFRRLPGVEVEAVSFGTGNLEVQFVFDEHGDLARSMADQEQRDTLPGLGLVSVPLNDREIDDLNWQCQLEASTASQRVHAEAAACIQNWDLAGALVHLGATPAEAAAVESLDLGLVSVLSTQKRGPNVLRSDVLARSACPATVPFAVQAQRAAAVQAAGCFLAGGADARMAKLRRSVGFSARAHGVARAGHRPDDVRMLTATYADGVEWDANHVRSLMDNVRKWHNRQGIKCRYVWVAEIQDGKRRADGQGRGAVHYHIALFVPQGAPHMPMADKRGWWPHGSTRTELARGAVQYLMHYLKKGNSKHFGLFPEGCRIYGVGGLDYSMRRARRWLGLPGFVQGNSSAADDWRRSPKGVGGWQSPKGDHYPSEFRRVNCGGVMALQRIRTHARAIEASGPFLWLSDRPIQPVVVS